MSMTTTKSLNKEHQARSLATKPDRGIENCDIQIKKKKEEGTNRVIVMFVCIWGFCALEEYGKREELHLRGGHPQPQQSPEREVICLYGSLPGLHRYPCAPAAWKEVLEDEKSRKKSLKYTSWWYTLEFWGLYLIYLTAGLKNQSEKGKSKSVHKAATLPVIFCQCHTVMFPGPLQKKLWSCGNFWWSARGIIEQI